MANLDQPRGFHPYRGDIKQTLLVGVDGGSSTIIYNGDVIDAEADGYCIAAAATADVSVIGVCIGCFNASMKAIKKNPASTAGFLLIAAAVKGQLFEAQADGTTLVADRFQITDHVAGAGNAYTNVSGHEVDSTIGQGQLRIVDKVDAEGNDWGASVDLVVEFNESLFIPAGAAV